VTALATRRLRRAASLVDLRDLLAQRRILRLPAKLSVYLATSPQSDVGPGSARTVASSVLLAGLSPGTSKLDVCLTPIFAIGSYPLAN
jgi:hypothetical protein